MVFLTDFGFEWPVVTTRTASAPPVWRDAFLLRANWSLGLMRNGNRHSHGLSFSMMTEDLDALPHLIEYRYRNWLGGGHAIDAGLGLRRTSVWGGTDLVPAKGYSAMLGYTPTRWIGASIRYDRVKANDRAFTALALGLQSTRVSEYAFKFVGIAIVDGLLAKIGFERDTSSSSQHRSLPRRD